MRTPSDLIPLASNDLLCGADFDEFNAGRGSRNGKAVFAEAFDVEFNSFLDELEDFVSCFRNCHTTRKIRDMCAKTRWALFDYDGVFHNEILFQTGLFENGVKRANRYVNIWFACHRNSAWSGRMFELPMTAFRSSQIPPVLFELLDEVANFHARIISNLSEEWKPHNV